MLFGTTVAIAQAEWTASLPVDITAVNTVLAKEKAINEAEIKGLAQLLAKRCPTLPAAERDRLAQSHGASCLSSFEIYDEKFSGVRYRAQIVLQYTSSCVEALLETKGITPVYVAPSETKMNPPLLLTGSVSQNASRIVTWALGTSQWEREIEKQATQNRLSVTFPLHDIMDQKLLTPLSLRSLSFKSLELPAAHYQVDTVYLLVLDQLSIGEQFQGTATPYIIKPLRVVACPSVIKTYDKNEQDLRVLAAETLKTLTGCMGAYADSLHKEESYSLTVSFEFKDMAEWFHFYKQIRSLSGVQGVVLQALQARQGCIVVSLNGDKTHFIQSFISLGFKVSEISDHSVIIYAKGFKEPGR